MTLASLETQLQVSKASYRAGIRCSKNCSQPCEAGSQAPELGRMQLRAESEGSDFGSINSSGEIFLVSCLKTVPENACYIAASLNLFTSSDLSGSHRPWQQATAVGIQQRTSA